jgi:hypothetical protein
MPKKIKSLTPIDFRIHPKGGLINITSVDRKTRKTVTNTSVSLGSVSKRVPNPSTDVQKRWKRAK